MKQWVIVFGALSLWAVTALGIKSATDDNKKVKSIKEIMGRCMKGNKSLRQTILEELKSDSPDWDKIQKSTGEMNKLASQLVKNDPPKGDKESWETMCKTLEQNTKALDDTAKKKDTEAVQNAWKKIGTSCVGCHKAHRE